MTSTQVQPTISPRVFWDTDVTTLDFEKDKLYVMDKVLNYGIWDDFVAMMKYYGKEVVKREAVRLPYLKKDVLNFLCFYLGLKPAQFVCYTRRQLQEPHWDF
ncbi:MAG TPA: hypothetical protein PK228_14650 [Saprospiraceae bacterium]|nr:hypothetical protein [Saprospiraceae bacterium]